MHDLHQLVEESLEAARQEIARRLTTVGYPTCAEVSELVISSDEDLSSWSSSWQSRQVSTLHVGRGLLRAIDDDSVPHRPIGLRPQLEPLAEHLNETTNLSRRQGFMLPNLTGAEAVLNWFVLPMALYYVEELADVAVPDPTLVARLATELDALCEHPETVFQLAVSGIHVTDGFESEGWIVRSLTPRERGAIYERRGGIMQGRLVDSDFVIPQSMDQFHSSVPSTLLQLSIRDYDFRMGRPPTVPNKLALAFHLLGYPITSAGSLAYYERPIWASQGIRQSPFPLVGHAPSESREVTLESFLEIAELAKRIPSFSGVEGSGKDIALYRTLRGCGSPSPDDGFLDYAIALEAALLGGVRDELAYRFRLYGALFLSGERNPTETAAALRQIYDVRSKLVHGSKVKVEDRQMASRHAAELAKAVIHKSVIEGWPQRQKLEEMALRTGSGDSESRTD